MDSDPPQIRKPRTRAPAPTPDAEGFALEVADRIRRDDRIRAMYADGWRAGDIAYRFGITMPRVYGIVAAPPMGVPRHLWAAWQHLAAEGDAGAQRVLDAIGPITTQTEGPQ